MATSVALGGVETVSTGSDGTLVIGDARRGVLRVGADGRIRTVIPAATGGNIVEVADARAADADGQQRERGPRAPREPCPSPSTPGVRSS